jgi:hypothetical protein
MRDNRQAIVLAKQHAASPATVKSVVRGLLAPRRASPRTQWATQARYKFGGGGGATSPYARHVKINTKSIAPSFALQRICTNESDRAALGRQLDSMFRIQLSLNTHRCLKAHILRRLGGDNFPSRKGHKNMSTWRIARFVAARASAPLADHKALHQSCHRLARSSRDSALLSSLGFIFACQTPSQSVGELSDHDDSHAESSNLSTGADDADDDTTPDSSTLASESSADDDVTTEDPGDSSAESDETASEEQSDGNTDSDQSDETSSQSDDSSSNTESDETSDPFKELGENCAGDHECKSGFCWQEAGDSACSLCKTDEDCAAAGSGKNCTYLLDLSNGSYLACSDGMLGEWCRSDTACDSNICNMTWNGIPLSRGFCSLCHSHQECRDLGTGVNCATSLWDDASEPYSKCTDGQKGSPCVEATDCASGLLCAFNPINPPPNQRSCSECESNSDCNDAADGETRHRNVCHLHTEYRGDFGDEAVGDHFDCVAESSIPNGEYCHAAGDGDEACDGFCPAIPWGDESLGLCSPCRPDHEGDCPSGQTCQTPNFGPNGPEAAFCQ